MKHLILVIALAAASAPAVAGVSMEMGAPGFYGRIEIGGFPPPPLIFPQPVIIERSFFHRVRQPIYLHVPPGHAKDWAKHCGKYDACGHRVYFVHHAWYDDVYVPTYRSKHGGGGGGGKSHAKSHGKGHGKSQGKGKKH